MGGQQLGLKSDFGGRNSNKSPWRHKGAEIGCRDINVKLYLCIKNYKKASYCVHHKKADGNFGKKLIQQIKNE